MALFGRLFKNSLSTDVVEESNSAPPETYRIVDLTLIPAGLDNLLARTSLASEVLLIPAEAGEFLSRCGTFATLEEHAERIEDELGLEGLNRGNVLKQLRHCADLGLLLLRSALTDDRPLLPTSSGTRITTAGITTLDRLATTQRAVTSFLGNAKQHNRSVELVIYNDARDEVIHDEHRRMLSALKSNYGGEFRYAGDKEKRRYAGWLIEAGLPAEEIEFCLFGAEGCGLTYGANSNAQLLDTIGTAMLHLDDDTICRIGSPPSAGPGIELCAGDPTEFRFFRDRNAAMASVADECPDLLALHESILGCSLRDCRGFGPDTEDLLLDRANDKLISSFNTGTGRIAATMMGVAGDSAMGSALYLLMLNDASRDRLVNDSAAYPELLLNRSVVRAAARTALCDATMFMTYAAAFDNREMLPPFFPVLRNHDGIFAETLAAVNPEAYIGHLPWVITHNPPESRVETRDNTFNAVTKTGIGTLVIRLTRSFAESTIPGASVPDRTRALGRHLQGVGQLESKEFRELVIDISQRSRADLATRLDQLLHYHEAQPEPWAQDVRDCLQTTLDSLTSRETPTLWDMQKSPSPEAGLDLARSLIKSYGKLLTSWPDIVSVARDLNSARRRLSEPV